MIIKEIRIVMPMTVEEYQIGQLFSIAEASRQETGGGEGVQVMRNEPFHEERLFNNELSSGQYTHKIYHVNSKLPRILRTFLPDRATTLHEHSWNAYPYCKTELTNPDYMGEGFMMRTETMHLSDRGTTENALNLTPEVLNRRDVVHINIAKDNEFLHASDIRDDTRPSTFRSERTGRGPLVQSWQNNFAPVMCVYKVVTIKFKWRPVGGLIERNLATSSLRMLSKFHREVFCWMDRWYGLTLAQIREIEDQTRRDLEEMRLTGDTRGMVA